MNIYRQLTKNEVLQKINDLEVHQQSIHHHKRKILDQPTIGKFQNEMLEELMEQDAIVIKKIEQWKELEFDLIVGRTLYTDYKEVEE